MGTESSTPPTEKIYQWLKLIVLVLTAIFALLHELTFITFFIVFLFIFVFSLNTFYNWKVKPDDKSKVESYKTFATWLNYSRRFFIALSIIIPLLCVFMTESHKYFPEWQQDYIKQHFTKDDEISELNPIKIPLDSLAKHPDLINQKCPMLMVKHGSTLYFYENTKINREMIRYAGDSFNVFAIVMACLLAVFTVVFILIDFVGSFQYEKPNNQNGQNE